MIKVIVGVILIGIIALVGAYYFGGTRTFDPEQQGEMAKSAVKPGMAWQEVIVVAGPPLKVTFNRKTKERIGGEDVEVIMEGPPMSFERPVFENTVASGALSEGFRFMYMFSAQTAFSVYFNENGEVADIDDDKTIVDLLDTRRK